jgi:alanyl-tRNA synthetase
MRSLEEELQKARRENRTKDDEIEHLKRRLSSAQKEIDHYRTKDADSQELLDTQRQELQRARAFLNTTDSYSGGDIIEMLHTLNSEVFQAVAIIIDTIEETHPSDGGYCFADEGSAVEKIEGALGDEVRVLLQRNGVEGDDIAIVQAALQTILNIALEHVCRLWFNGPLVDQVLKDVYGQIRAQQGQYNLRHTMSTYLP